MTRKFAACVQAFRRNFHNNSRNKLRHHPPERQRTGFHSASTRWWPTKVCCTEHGANATCFHTRALTQTRIRNRIDSRFLIHAPFMPRVTASPEEALRNAAELLLLLDADEARAVLAHLSAREASQVRAAIHGMNPLHQLFAEPAPDTVDINLDVPLDVPQHGEFSPSRLLSEPGQYVQGMLRQALGPTTSGAGTGSKSAQRAGGDGLARLKRTDMGTVAHYLAGEHPQISAVVLAWLERDVAARILQLVPPRLRNELMLRIAHLGQVQSAALQDLQEALADILTLHEARKEGPHGGVLTAVQLLTRLGTHLEGPMMEAIRAQDPAMAQRINDRLEIARTTASAAPLTA